MGSRLDGPIRFLVICAALASTNTAFADDADDRLHEEAVRWCASAPGGGDLDECADATFERMKGPQHKAMIADANRALAQILARCRRPDGNEEQFIRCAKQVNPAKTREARELAEAKATIARVDLFTAEWEQKKAATLQRCQKAGNTGIVRIGMTDMEVRVCGWGEPEAINRTVIRGLTHEQWVYPSRTYLYLDNGRVTAIQN